MNEDDNSNETILPDEHSNAIVAVEYDDTIEMYLKLSREKHRRHIDSIDKQRGYFFVVRKRGLHLHFKSNSYGFNQKVLAMAKRFTHVCISDELQNWKIPVSYILEKGQHLFFKEQGFEKQIFVTLEEIAQFEKKPKF